MTSQGDVFKQRHQQHTLQLTIECSAELRLSDPCDATFGLAQVGIEELASTLCKAG